MKKILIIDDEPDSIAVFELLLSHLEFEISSISNPHEAISTIQQVLPDLIILDWMMPQKEGIEVLMEIKAIPEIADIPVIIASGVRTNSGNLKEALTAGSIDLIKKPIDAIELEARVMSSIKMYDNLREMQRMRELMHANELEMARAKTIYYQNELSKREREMIVSAITIFQNRKLIGALKTEMTGLSEFNEAYKFQLFNLLERYENISNSFNWELFEKRFTELSAGFYGNIKSDFPTLTFAEQQICAFFKLGLTIKEIAILNYSNYEAVRKAVYRLRKKLNLNEKTELSVFLQAY